MLHKRLKLRLLLRRQNHPNPVPPLVPQHFPLRIRRRINRPNLRLGIINDRAQLLLLFRVQLQIVSQRRHQLVPGRVRRGNLLAPHALAP